MNDDRLQVLVDRFLSWPLPKSFAPDCGISFDGRKADQFNPHGKGWPIGTNLFTADEARQMIEYLLREPPVAAPAQGTPEPHALPPDVQNAVVERNHLRREQRELRAELRAARAEIEALRRGPSEEEVRLASLATLADGKHERIIARAVLRWHAAVKGGET
jgi:hypothetical protein